MQLGSLSRARPLSVNSLPSVAAAWSSRYFFSQPLRISAPTPDSAATALIVLEVEMTSRQSSSLNSWLNRRRVADIPRIPHFSDPRILRGPMSEIPRAAQSGTLPGSRQRFVLGFVSSRRRGVSNLASLPCMPRFPADAARSRLRILPEYVRHTRPAGRVLVRWVSEMPCLIDFSKGNQITVEGQRVNKSRDGPLGLLISHSFGDDNRLVCGSGYSISKQCVHMYQVPAPPAGFTLIASFP